MPLLIDGIQVKTPTNLKVQPLLIVKAERNAAGDMVGDIVAEKRRLDIEYSVIKDTELKQILDLLGSGFFHTVTYPDPQRGEATTITVYRGDVDTYAGQRINGTRYWRDVRLALIER